MPPHQRDSLTVYALRRLSANGASVAVLERVAGGHAEWMRMQYAYKIPPPPDPHKPAAPVAATVATPPAAAIRRPADDAPRSTIRDINRQALDTIADVVCYAFTCTRAELAGPDVRHHRPRAAFLKLAYENVSRAGPKMIARTVNRDHSTIFSHLRRHNERAATDPAYAKGYALSLAMVSDAMGRGGNG